MTPRGSQIRCPACWILTLQLITVAKLHRGSSNETMLGLGRSIRKEEILLPSLWRPPAAFQTKASECACFRSYASPESKAWVASHWHTLWFYVLLFMRNKTKKTTLAVRQTLNHQIHRRTEEKFPASHSLCAVICTYVHMCGVYTCTHGCKGQGQSLLLCFRSHPSLFETVSHCLSPGG